MIDSAYITRNSEWFVVGGGLLAFMIVLLMARYLRQPQAARISAVVTPLLFSPIPFASHNVFLLMPAQLWLVSGSSGAALLALIPLSLSAALGYTSSLWFSSLARKQLVALSVFMLVLVAFAAGMHALHQVATDIQDRSQ